MSWLCGQEGVLCQSLCCKESVLCRRRGSCSQEVIGIATGLGDQRGIVVQIFTGGIVRFFFVGCCRTGGSPLQRRCRVGSIFMGLIPVPYRSELPRIPGFDDLERQGGMGQGERDSNGQRKTRGGSGRRRTSQPRGQGHGRSGDLSTGGDFFA